MLYRANVRLKKKRTNSKRSTGKQSNSYLDDLSLQRIKTNKRKRYQNKQRTAKDQLANRVTAILMILSCKCKIKKETTNKTKIHRQRELQLSWWPDARQQRASQTHDAALLASASDLYRVVLCYIVSYCVGLCLGHRLIPAHFRWRPGNNTC